MPIRFKCPECHKTIKVSSKYAGKRGACPTCSKVVPIPALPEGGQALESDSESAESGRSEGIASSAPEPVRAEAAGAAGVGGEVLAPATPEQPVLAEAEAVKKVEADEAVEGSVGGGFIKFDCPGCGKRIGFSAARAQTPGKCPSCHVNLMIPEREGDESFLLGEAPPVTQSRRVTPVLRKPHPEPVPVPPAQAKPSLGAFAAGVVVAAVVIVSLVMVLAGTRSSGNAHGDVTANLSGPSSQGQPSALPAGRAEPMPVETGKAVPGGMGDLEVRSHRLEEGASAQPGGERAKSGRPDSGADPLVPPASAAGQGAVRSGGAEGQGGGSGRETEDALRLAERRGSKTAEEEEEDPRKAGGEKKVAEPGVGEGGLEGEGGQEKKGPRLFAPEAGQEKGPGAAGPEGGQAAPKNAEPAFPPIPPVCKKCLGTEHLPILPYRPYWHLEGQAAPKPAAALPWIFCKACQPKRDNQELLVQEEERLRAAAAQHKAWEDGLGMSLVRAETRHVTIHAHIQPPLVQQVAESLEKLSGHLEKVTQTTLLTQTRPDKYQILIFFDATDYKKLVEHMATANPGQDFSLMAQTTGFSTGDKAFYHLQGNASLPPEHMALHQLGKMMIRIAAGEKAPIWLTEGFAAYCENAITSKNLVYSFRYEMNQVKFGESWNEEIKVYAKKGQLKEWPLIFQTNLIGMGALDYLTCYSMVRFLLSTDPQRFQAMCQELKDGADSQAALEKVYGKKIREIQQLWAKWAWVQR